MASAKKLSFTQRAALPAELNPKEWLYVGEEVIGDNGKVSRNVPKNRYMIIQHKITQERRRVLL